MDDVYRFTNMNKAYPKNVYPHPKIDTLVDNTSGHHILNFLDAYSEYNQIPMYPSNLNKMAFIIEETNYYFEVMSFGLKNDGPHTKKLMDKIFLIRLVNA